MPSSPKETSFTNFAFDLLGQGKSSSEKIQNKWQAYNGHKTNQNLHNLYVACSYRIRRSAYIACNNNPLFSEDIAAEIAVQFTDIAKRYDPTQGAKFSTFLELRTRGEALDHMRDHLQRTQGLSRQEGRQKRNIEDIIGKSGHITTDEIARIIKTTKPYNEDSCWRKNFQKENDFYDQDDLLKRINKTRNLLDSVHNAHPHFKTLPEQIVESSQTQRPDEVIATSEFNEAYRTAVSQLPERERKIFEQYAIEEMTLKEIGTSLGVTESRISQILAQAKSKLAKKLQPHQEQITNSSTLNGIGLHY